MGIIHEGDSYSAVPLAVIVVENFAKLPVALVSTNGQ
jgi:hypothetical protein